MRSLFLLLALTLSAPALAQFDAQHRPPDWMVRGFEAAVADPKSLIAAIRKHEVAGLAEFVPPERAGAVVDRLTPLLGDPISDVRSAAAQTLAKLTNGDRAGTVVDSLTPLLGDSQSSVRTAAAEALAKLATGDRAGAVVDKLTPLLGDSDRFVRSAAVVALVELATGDRAGAVVDKLTPLLGVSDPGVRSEAAEALANFATGDRAGAVVDKLTPLLGDSNSIVRSAAARALGQITPTDRAGAVVDKLTPLLGDSDTNVRSASAQALGHITPTDRVGGVVDELTRLLGDSDVGLRSAVAAALAKLATGGGAGAVVDKLKPLLIDSNSAVRSGATEALGQIPLGGDRVGGVVDELTPLLRDSDVRVRSAVPEALAKLATGERAGAVVDKLTSLLGDPDWHVRFAAKLTLVELAAGDRARTVVDKLTPLLHDPNDDTRFAAAEALGQITPTDRADGVVDKLTPLIGDSNSDVRSAAAHALGQITPRNRADWAVDELTPLLGDSDPYVLSAAAQALVKLATGNRASGMVDKLVPLLNDPNDDKRFAAVQALGQITPTDRAGGIVDNLTPLLGDSNGRVRSVAAQALGHVTPGERAGAVVDKLAPLLGVSSVSGEAIRAIAQIGPGGVSASVAIVRLINASRDEDTGWLRAAAHVSTGADAKKEGGELLLGWLGRPAEPPLKSVADDPSAAHELLQLLTGNWAALSKEPRAREEAENAAMAAIEEACRTPVGTSNLADFAGASFAWLRDLPNEGPIHRCWTPEQKATVEKLLRDFKESHSTHEKALADHLKGEGFAPVGLWLTRSLVAWAVFWIAFLFAFPWSRTIQAIFFWNPRVRKMMSLWFVPLLLLVLPPLRRRLLAPFRDDLVAQAHLDDLPKLGYFAGRARVNGGEPIPLSQLQSSLRGVAVLQADSGLGKTSLLRETAARARRPVAFLHARDCADGVDVAISRIIHNMQETGFVRSLVHTRALLVIVDGLNEVSADTREKIGVFAREMSKGDVIVATQPIEWRPPPNSRTVELLPLNRSEATAFIESRPVGADPNQPCHGPTYKAAAEKFVARGLDEAPSEFERETAELMLSNPFDLAFAAELLARGRMPSPTALIDEAFRLADERYREVAKAPFPLKAFGRYAVKMRLEDRNWLEPDKFVAEASCLLEQRLVVSRAMKGAQGILERHVFRHDRVWDFFIAAAFADDPDLWAEHVGDARFRGAYLRIAETWDPESAGRVRDQLSLSAADSGDHSTSDEFIKRLAKRFRAKKAVHMRAVAR